MAAFGTQHGDLRVADDNGVLLVSVDDVAAAVGTAEEPFRHLDLHKTLPH